jgi:hypothetical protein
MEYLVAVEQGSSAVPVAKDVEVELVREAKVLVEGTLDPGRESHPGPPRSRDQGRKRQSP